LILIRDSSILILYFYFLFQEETATVSADSSLESYRRREDFKGHTEVSEKERRLIQTFLAKDDLG